MEQTNICKIVIENGEHPSKIPQKDGDKCQASFSAGQLKLNEYTSTTMHIKRGKNITNLGGTRWHYTRINRS
jgi:hypothetical protein